MQLFNVLGQSIKIVIRFLFTSSTQTRAAIVYKNYLGRSSDWEFAVWLREIVMLPKDSDENTLPSIAPEKWMAHQVQWLKDNKIERVPLIIYDGYVLAEPYQIKDIAVFV